MRLNTQDNWGMTLTYTAHINVRMYGMKRDASNVVVNKLVGR